MTTKIYRCAICNRKLSNGKWVVGKDRRITGTIPRYCLPMEGCGKKTISNLRSRKERIK